jgi:hypothetical protein
VNSQVAVLGCGPAGLLAVHALVTVYGVEPVVYAKGPRSVIHGAQFLHVPIPDLTTPDPDATVKFKHWGVVEEYAMKVYRDANAPCSWRAFGEEVPIWSMQRTYEELWARYHGLIKFVELSLYELSVAEDRHKVIISTIPAPALCYKPSMHRFTSASVKVTDSAQDRVPANGIVLNGIYEDLWYRSSDIMGYTSTEWPGQLPPYQLPGNPHYTEVRKPLTTNCDCRPEIIRAGRFGEWRKGVLVHHAYDKAKEALSVV